jgi:uncharacterized membrane protein YcaP (DUF421 family)
MLIVIRALGKRTVGNFAAFDLLVALMLGEIVDEIIYGDVSFLQGMVAIAVIAAAESGNSWLTYWGHGFDTLLEGKPTVLVRDGRLEERGLRAERMSMKDLMGHLRSQGVQDVREVKMALLEDDGSVSVIRRRWAEPAQRADVEALASAEREADTGGRGQPDGDERTDAPRWLE